MYELFVFCPVGCYEEDLWQMGFSLLEWYWHCTVEHGEVGKITNLFNLWGLRYVVMGFNERPHSPKWWKNR